MHRREDLWGPDGKFVCNPCKLRTRHRMNEPLKTTASEFDPDRFLDERLKQYLNLNAFIFLPFNAGPRICLGKQVGYIHSDILLLAFICICHSVCIQRNVVYAYPTSPKFLGYVS